MMDSNFVALLIIAAVTLYFYLKRRYTYWQTKGLDYLEPDFFYGNIKKMAIGELSFGGQFKELYGQLKKKEVKHGGIYMFFNPVYMPLDPAIIKRILQKDFEHFRNHGVYVNEKTDPLSGHLFNLEDEKWRNIRVKLTATFTSGKIKMMFPILATCGNSLQNLLHEHAATQDPTDIKEILSRFTIDIIGSCAFGLDCNSLNDPNTDFLKYGLKIFDGSFGNKMRLLLSFLLPVNVLTKIGYKFTNQDVESFFINIIKQTVQYRETNKIYRKDFIQLLLELKDDEVIDIKTGKEQDAQDKVNRLTINEIAAQSFGFFVAGFETSATTMSFALYELAANPEIQEKLRGEIAKVLQKYDDNLTYESIMEMMYLDKVVDETLRKYPPAPGTPRKCNTPYTVPGTNVVIEPGVMVHIPILGIHHDSEYYPDPEIFDPERFSEENKLKRPAFTYLPFGEGPRICVGARFGLLQTKVGLVSVLRKFSVTLNEKTETPLRLDGQSFVLASKNGIWLNIHEI